jgi:hypothetical protein
MEKSHYKTLVKEWDNAGTVVSLARQVHGLD